MRVDLTGQKFNMLSVIKRADFEKYKGNTTWECQCECGNIVEVDSQSLRRGYTKSCGCLRKETTSQTGKKTIKILLMKIS